MPDTVPAARLPRVVYQLFPLGLCGALPDQAPHHGGVAHKNHPRGLRDLEPWLDHMVSLGADTLLLGPVFASSNHGYDTIDPRHVDPRLGTDDDLQHLVGDAHARGIAVVLDAVFNHLGRASAPFRALQHDGGGGQWRPWFSGVREGRSPLGDPFDYDTWGGHHELPRLDTDHADVRAFWADVVQGWYRRFDIDGLRLDAADCVSPDFVRFIADVARKEKPDTWLVGEVVHGDYNERLGDDLLDSITNYELYKSLWSGIESRCAFETAYALHRQFGDDGVYRDHRLLSFVDNHDVKRLATTLSKPSAQYPAWGVLMTAPGIPTIYYGSEFGLPGEKTATSDAPVRPALDLSRMGPEAAERGPAARDLVDAVRRFTQIRARSPALQTGDYREYFIGETSLVFGRTARHAENDNEDAVIEDIMVLVNADDAPIHLRPGRPCRRDGQGGATIGQRVWDHDKLGHCRGVDVDPGRFEDLLAPGSFYDVVDGRLEVEVPGNWLAILRRC